MIGLKSLKLVIKARNFENSFVFYQVFLVCVLLVLSYDQMLELGVQKVIFYSSVPVLHILELVVTLSSWVSVFLRQLIFKKLPYLY